MFSRILVLDTETTGIDKSKDEILQLSMIDGQGNEVFNRYLRPERHTEWPEAMKVNGITPEMVANEMPLSAYLDGLQTVLDWAEAIVGYNVKFDIDFLKAAGLKVKATVVDIMPSFAYVYGEWNDFRHNYRWQKLTTCAKYYGYDWGKDTAHDSLCDCRATLFCYQKMAENGHLGRDDKGKVVKL